MTTSPSPLERELQETLQLALGRLDEVTFSAESPYAIADLYADGRISQTQLLTELGCWPYARCGGIADLDRAEHDGLIDENEHQLIRLILR